MAEPVNMQTLGGLTYNVNLVKSTKTNDDGTYTINFKTGETLHYPEQKPLQPALGKAKERYDAEQQKWVPSGEFYIQDRQNPKAVTGELLGDCKSLFKKDETVPRNARVDVTINEGLIYDDSYFNITNVMGATFTSSPDVVSHVTLKNSSGTTINLASNDSAYYGDNANIEMGADNMVILDEEDTAKINGKSVAGEGTAAQKDYDPNEGR